MNILHFRIDSVCEICSVTFLPAPPMSILRVFKAALKPAVFLCVIKDNEIPHETYSVFLYHNLKILVNSIIFPTSGK